MTIDAQTTRVLERLAQGPALKSSLVTGGVTLTCVHDLLARGVIAHVGTPTANAQLPLVLA